MSIPVALRELADAMADYRFAYLMTVGDDERVHAVAVTPRLDGERLVIDNPGRRSRANTAVRGGVSMVWPPVDADGYSLIVDGDVTDGDASSAVEDVLTVTPAHAVKHRPAAPDQSTPASACGSDCVPVEL